MCQYGWTALDITVDLILCHYFQHWFYLNIILKLFLSLHWCIWYHVTFFLPSYYTMSKTCDHFTASGKHVWNCVSACSPVVCCKYPVYDALCASSSNITAFSGSSYHIDMLKCETFHTLTYWSNSKVELALLWHCLGFFFVCFSCRQRCYGVAMIQ